MIRMTEREKVLTQASEAGRKSYEYNWSMGSMFIGDAGLTEAWNQGFQIARAEDKAWRDHFDSMYKI